MGGKQKRPALQQRKGHNSRARQRQGPQVGALPLVEGRAHHRHGEGEGHQPQARHAGHIEQRRQGGPVGSGGLSLRSGRLVHREGHHRRYGRAHEQQPQHSLQREPSVQEAQDGRERRSGADHHQGQTDGQPPCAHAAPHERHPAVGHRGSRSEQQIDRRDIDGEVAGKTEAEGAAEVRHGRHGPEGHEGQRTGTAQAHRRQHGRDQRSRQKRRLGEHPHEACRAQGQAEDGEAQKADDRAGVDEQRREQAAQPEHEKSQHPA